MPAPKSSASSLLTAGLGIVGFSALAGLLAAVMVAPAVAVGGITTNNTVGIFDSLPDYMEIGQQFEANEILAKNADGSDFHIATLYDQNRQSVPLDQMSDYIKEAAVSGEDRRYYQHGGIDVPSVARAALGQATGTSGSGASTITMQLVRQIRFQEAANETGVTEKKRAEDIQAAVAPDLGRKVQEMKLAIGLEKKYSKQQILDAYLNIVGMGGNTYGVEAASEQYFSTTAANLSIAQAASIMAIVQNPNSRNLGNAKNFAANQQRRDFIIKSMRTDGYITQAQADEALKIPIDANYVKPSTPKQGCLYAAPGYQFICDLVDTSVKLGEVKSIGATKEEAQQNWKQGGYKVYTSIQPAMQDAGNAIVKKYAPASEQRFALGAADATVEVGTGRILMEAQNKDYSNLPTDPNLTDYQRSLLPTTALNLAEDQRHGGGGGYQPGSTFKPYTLLSYLAAGHGLNDVFNASVTSFPPSKYVASCASTPNGGPPYKVTNDQSNEVGPMTVTQGTAQSVNTVFMQMGQKVDQCDTMAMAESIGVHNSLGADVDPLKTYPSCVIGACQTIAPITQAAAYAAIANGGVFCNPIIVDSIQNADGDTLPGQDAQCAQSALLTPDIAHTATYAMQQVFIGNGTASAANPKDGTVYMGKTGTTDFSHQTWTVGSSTKASTALWVGNISGPVPGDPNKTQQLRRINVGGIQAATLRNNIFRETTRAIDGQPGFKGDAFPPPAKNLLQGQKATVPSGLVGGSVQAAQSALDAAGLTYQDGGPVDSDLPAGTVASVDPGEGAQVAQGAFVKVYTSNGLAQPVPTVTGQTENDARNALKAAGFTSVTTQCTVWTGPTDPDAGKVVQQSPSGGSSANPANPVTIVVKKPSC